MKSIKRVRDKESEVDRDREREGGRQREDEIERYGIIQESLTEGEVSVQSTSLY